MSWDNGDEWGAGRPEEDRPDDTVLRRPQAQPPARPQPAPEPADPEADLTQIRPGPPPREEVGQWSGPNYNRSRLTDESLWERTPAPPVAHPAGQPGRQHGGHLVSGRDEPPPGAVPPKVAPRPTRRLQLVALVALAGVAILAAWVLNPRGSEPDTGRVAPRRAVAAFAKPVEEARLPDRVGGLQRDTSRNEAKLPFGNVDRAHYRSADGQAVAGGVYALTMNSPVASLTDLEAHSGLGNRNRFGPVSCGRADVRIECVTLLKGGLLVVVGNDPQADMGQVAAATTELYNALPG